VECLLAVEARPWRGRNVRGPGRDLKKTVKLSLYYVTPNTVLSKIDLSTARPKWRLDGPALSGHLLYSLVNHAYAKRYHHHLVL